MHYEIVVPEPVLDAIGEASLPSDVEDELFDDLGHGLTQKELDSLRRVPAPGPTFLLELESRDPVLFGVVHHFTLWLVFGPDPQKLYVYQFDHRQHEDWGTDDHDDDS